jgi:hypothetical protein
MYHYALGGAILTELLLRERVRITPGKKDFVEPIDARETGDALLDEAFERIATSKRRARTRTWISRIANTKKLKHRIAGNLCRRGILAASEDKVLFLFTRRVYPEIRPEPEREILDRLTRAVFSDEPEVDARTVVLVALAHHSGLLRANFDRKRLKKRKARIERVINGDLVGRATKEAIEAVQAAVMAALVTTTIVTTTS